VAVTTLRRIDRICLNSADLASLVSFFVNGLGFSLDDHTRHLGGTTLSLGPTRLELNLMGPVARPYPGDVPGWSPLFQHFAIAVPDVAVALNRLRAVEDWSPISVAGPERLPSRSSGVTAFKFRDPEGHPLELISLSDADNCCRIDHTAISVADTARSISFYSGLGLQVASQSLNYGPEQDRLDAVPDARVEVTGMRIPSAPAPHLELLCYRGTFSRCLRLPEPADAAATRTVLALKTKDSRQSIRRAYHASLLTAPLGRDGEETVLLRDPDGHVLQLEVDQA
jgi:catechol 2,3-dioxygenase-like lactoylglutathione lyase family enzyme